jgi:hypothetical protein
MFRLFDVILHDGKPNVGHIQLQGEHFFLVYNLHLEGLASDELSEVFAIEGDLYTNQSLVCFQHKVSHRNLLLIEVNPELNETHWGL